MCVYNPCWDQQSQKRDERTRIPSQKPRRTHSGVTVGHFKANYSLMQKKDGRNIRIVLSECVQQTPPPAINDRTADGKTRERAYNTGLIACFSRLAVRSPAALVPAAEILVYALSCLLRPSFSSIPSPCPKMTA